MSLYCLMLWFAVCGPFVLHDIFGTQHALVASVVAVFRHGFLGMACLPLVRVPRASGFPRRSRTLQADNVFVLEAEDVDM